MLRYLRWAPEMWSSEINEAVIALVAPEPGERVVDIGAGMGPGTVLAARAGASVIAVEPTPFMRIIVSVRRWFLRSRDLVTVVDGAAEQIPADDASVDAVWAVNTMHHWVDTEAAVVEIARVMRPGGRVVLVDEDFADPAHPEFERFGSGDDAEHHGFTMVDASEMGDLLEAAGLTDVEAGKRTLAGCPVLAVTGRAAG
jgi:SAM-dependent methyltransferase